MPLTILADDLTGACDTGALFTGHGPVAVVIARGRPAPGRGVSVLDTESRSLPPAAAARRVDDAFGALAPARRRGRLFKKIDSAFRGRVGAEVEAILAITKTAGALICPAFPDEGRTVVGRILHIHGEPVHTTAIGRDPDFPGSSSDLVEIVRARASRPVHWLSLPEVRGELDALRRALNRLGQALVVADAESARDLQHLAVAALASPHRPLPVGSAGLAGALAGCLGLAGPPVALAAGPARLFVAGSLHPLTRSQIGALEGSAVAGVQLVPGTSRPELGLAPVVAAIKSGRPAFVTLQPPGGSPAADERRLAAALLARVTAAILREATPDLLVLVGGETAAAVYRALEADRIDVAGSPRPGLAFGHLRGGRAEGMSLLTKAGGFGGPDLLASLLGRSGG